MSRDPHSRRWLLHSRQILTSPQKKLLDHWDPSVYSLLMRRR